MKTYSKKTFKTRKWIEFVLITIILIGTTIGGVFVLNSYSAIADFSFEFAPDPSTFLDPDLELLENVAVELDDRYANYHLPLNQTSSVTFYNDSATNGGEVSYTNVSAYHFSDNEALWGGIDYTGWTYKYLTALQENDTSMAEFALNVLINMTTGLTMLMIVPNGGLGSDYGGILARGFAPPGSGDIWPNLVNNYDHPKHFNGSGDYANWRWRGYTSNDEFGGYYLFLAIATRYLQDVPFIQERVSLIVDQLCYNFIKTNFLGIHGTGALTGVDQKPRLFTGGFWIPLLLKMGAIYYPEKYEQIYIQQVANEMIYLSATEAGAQETFANYYAYNFGLCVCLAYLLVEDSSTAIWNQYFEGFYDSLWTFMKYHRNSWANAIFLMICHENGIVNNMIEDNLTLIQDDVNDQLQRFTTSHYPNYNYLMSSELPEGYEIVQPVKSFVEALGLNENAQRFLGIEADERFLNKPLTVDYIDIDGWVWNNNPYEVQDDSYSNLLVEYVGSSFTVPYWMMRYMGAIQGGN